MMPGSMKDLFGDEPYEWGEWRRERDPATSEAAAKSIKVSRLQLLVLRTLATARTPLNGWEIAVKNELPTISIVPRLAPLRRMGLIDAQGKRGGPSGRDQIAYVISPAGSTLLTLPP